MKQLLLAALAMCAGAGVATAADVLVFDETFPNCKAETKGGGYFYADLYFDSEGSEGHDPMSSTRGWLSQNCYMGERCVKFSAKTKKGNLLTPKFTLHNTDGADITVYFHAQTWKGDNVETVVELLDQNDMPLDSKSVDADDTEMISNRSKEAFSVNFSNVPSGARLRFMGKGKEGGTGVTRFFLSDIRVVEHNGDENAKFIEASSGYFKFNDLMAGKDSEIHRLYFRADENSQAPEMVLPAISNFEIVAQGPAADKSGWNYADLRFVPINSGAKEETAILVSGNLKKEIILTGLARVYTPEVAEASNVTASSFTANWQPIAGMDQFEVVVYTMEEGPIIASNLMITKYIEGSSNNRALEIFNGTANDVDLTGWTMAMEANGAGGLTFGEFKFPDGTILEKGKCYTIANAQFGAVRDKADFTIGFNNGGYENVVVFTGDDAIALFDPEHDLVDIIGYESYDLTDILDPNWGTDKSFYRKADVSTPHPKFYPGEWDVYEKDYCEGYGAHEMDEYGDYRVILGNYRCNGTETSREIEGLQPNTRYYYAVRGLSGDIKTHYSDVVEVITTNPTEGVENTAAEAAYSYQNGKVILLNANAAVFNIQGIKIAANAEGIVTLPAPGVYVVAFPGGADKIVF